MDRFRPHCPRSPWTVRSRPATQHRRPRCPCFAACGTPFRHRHGHRHRTPTPHAGDHLPRTARTETPRAQDPPAGHRLLTLATHRHTSRRDHRNHHAHHCAADPRPPPRSREPRGADRPTRQGLATRPPRNRRRRPHRRHTALVVWSHPVLISNEAAFAMLAGAAPILASSRQTIRHRLNRRGDRHLNSALHIVAIQRQRHDPRTIAYFNKRRAEGKPTARSDDASSATSPESSTARSRKDLTTNRSVLSEVGASKKLGEVHTPADLRAMSPSPGDRFQGERTKGLDRGVCGWS